METIVVINFTYACNEKTLSDLAMNFAANVKPDIDGLIWKIFVNDPDRRHSAGLYLFRDLECANEYLNSSYARHFNQSQIVSDVSVETFQTMREPSIRAGAPIGEPGLPSD
jgi:hypothetical protein